MRRHCRCHDSASSAEEGDQVDVEESMTPIIDQDDQLRCDTPAGCVAGQSSARPRDLASDRGGSRRPRLAGAARTAACGGPAESDDGPRTLLNCLPDGPALALVAHSNAGLYLPSVAAERRVVASVYADAALPTAVGATPLAPPAMRACCDSSQAIKSCFHRGQIGGTRRNGSRSYQTPPLEPQ